MTLIIRSAHAGDGEAIARIHADMLTHYAEVDPDAFHAPDLEGFADWVAGDFDTGSDTELYLVAELDGE